MANGFGDMFDSIFKSHVDPRLSDLYAAIGGLGESIEQLIEETTSEVAEETYAYQRGTASTLATTTADITLGPTPTGTAWLITNLAWVSGAGGIIDVYIDGVADGNLIYTNATGLRGAQVGVDLYVPAGRQVIIRFTNLANNIACSVNAVVKLYIRQPDVDVSGGNP